MTARATLRMVALMGFIAVAGCAAAHPGAREALSACPRGDTLMVRAVLEMGRNIPGGGTVSDSAWKEFVASYVTPRFPGGFSLMEGEGQWRNANGTIERERGMTFSVLHGGDPASERAVIEISQEYKRRFRQEAVLRERSLVCAHFDS